MASLNRPTVDTQSAKSTESETRQTADKSATLLLLALLKQWKRNAPPSVEAKIGPNPEVSVRVGENQIYKGLADSPQIAAIPKDEIDYLKFATSLEQGYSHVDLTRDIEIKIGGHKVFEVVGGEVTRNQIGPSQDQKISIDIPGETAPQTELQEPAQTSGPSTQTRDLSKFVAGMDSHIKSMPKSEQAQYEGRVGDIFLSEKFVDYKDKANELSVDLYGKSYDTIYQESQIESPPISPDQEVSDNSFRESTQETVVEGMEADAVSAPEPGSREDVLDAARYIAKEMGDSDYSGGRSVETDSFKIETYGNEVKVFDREGNKVIEADPVSGPDLYQPTPELVDALTESANELERQEIEHDTPEVEAEVDEGIEIDGD